MNHLAERGCYGPDLHSRRLYKGAFSTAGAALILPSLLSKANILNDETCVTNAADFGLLRFISDPGYLLSSISHSQCGTVRWMNPELFASERFGFQSGRPIIPSDCYALRMVGYETFGGNLLFHEDADPIASSKVVEGKHPPRGARFAESLWETVELCWAPRSPNNRPGVEAVLQCLELARSLSEPTPPTTDEGDGEDSVRLSEYCFNLCKVLQTVTQRRNVDLNEFVRVALEYPERCDN